MALVERDEFDAAVAVPMVVPVEKCARPTARLALAGKEPAVVIRPVFDSLEQGF